MGHLTRHFLCAPADSLRSLPPHPQGKPLFAETEQVVRCEAAMPPAELPRRASPPFCDRDDIIRRCRAGVVRYLCHAERESGIWRDGDDRSPFGTHVGALKGTARFRGDAETMDTIGRLRGYVEYDEARLSPGESQEFRRACDRLAARSRELGWAIPELDNEWDDPLEAQ